MSGIVERFIAGISPKWAANRAAARADLDRTRAYEAASSGDRWLPRRSGASANADFAGDARKVLDKARALYQNVGFIAAGIEGRVAHGVGTGIQHVAQGSFAKAVNNAFKEWATDADADGHLSYYGLQEIGWRALDVDGEFLVRFIRTKVADGKVPLKLQILECDYIDSSKNESYGANTIVNGIEYDQGNSVAAYWLFDHHPGDVNTWRGYSMKSNRVPAKDIIHVFNKRRPGQGRGISRLAPVIADARDLRLYQVAELDRKNTESRFGVMVHGGAAANLSPGMNMDSSDARYLGDLPSGGVMQIPTGMSVTSYQARASGDYVAFMTESLHRIAAAIGVTYEIMTGDLSEVSFTSSRAGRIAMKADIDRQQWNSFIPMFCRRVHREFVETAILAGIIPVRSSMDVDFTTPKWESVQPLDQAKADLLEIAGGLSSLSEKQRERGYYDTEALKTELAADIESLKKLGIWEDMMALQGLTAPTQQNNSGKIA